MKKRYRKGFTLIEMLVVMVVIGIIMGMIFKMFSMAARSSAKANTIQVLERVANAVNEYYAEYGMYPPVNTVAYTYENVEATKERATASVEYYSEAGGNAPTRQYGLVAYLTRCPPPDESFFCHGANWLQDNNRDINAKARWAPFLDGLVDTLGAGIDNAIPAPGSGGNNYFETRKVIRDAWLNYINYESLPPYQSYRLWSNGPNGNNNNGNGDDIVVNMAK